MRIWMKVALVTAITAGTTCLVAVVVSLATANYAEAILPAFFVLAQPTLYRAMTYGL